MKKQFDYEMFGLEPRDVAVYEAMLASDSALSIRSLAEATHMNRGTTFEIIKKLVQLGLVTSHYKQSRKYYTAADPAVLRSLAEDRYRNMAGELDKIDRYVASLHTLQSPEAPGRFGVLYEGEDEIALLLHDVLGTVSVLPDRMYRVVSSAEVSNHLYKKFENFTRQRIRMGIFAKVIGVGGTDELRPLADRKVLSVEHTPDSYLLIYGDKVAQISLAGRGLVRGSVIENSGIAQLQALLFDKLWEQL